jgi:SAM-dependent methyltransferase
LRFFWPIVTGSEDFYAQLQKISWYYAAAKQEFVMAAKYVRGGDVVLEVGAGRGLFSREVVNAGSYTGLEFSSAAIELAAKGGVRLLPETVEHHAVNHPGHYDVVCTFQVLEHVADPRSFLQASIDCLRAGGLLIVSVPAEDSFARFAYRDVLNMPPHHITRWTDDSLRAIASILGLELVALTPEPLGKNMRRAYARAMVEERIGALTGMQLQQLDPRLNRGPIKAIAGIGAVIFRRWLALTGAKGRRGHAVLAVFRKP